MPEKVKCENCQNMTFKLARCTRCGAPLDFGESEENRADNDKKAWKTQQNDQNEFAKQYGLMQDIAVLDSFKFGKYLSYNQLKGTPFMGIRRLSVPTGWKALVFAEHGQFEMELPSGLYPVSQRHVDANPLAGFMDSFTGASLGIFMVVDHEFNVTFTVPEAGENAVFENLSTCNIRSAEGFMGGVSVTMNLRIKDPLRTFYLKGDAMKRPESTPASGLQAVMAPLVYLKTQLVGQSVSGDDPIGFSNLDLWEKIRMEFVSCVRSAVLDESAEEMRSSVEVRERVKGELDEGLQVTMDRYGFEIVRVSAFSFLSPDHDKILSQQGEIAASSARLAQEKQMQRQRAEQRDVNVADAVGSAEAEREIEQASSKAQTEVELTNKEAEARVREASDQNLAAGQARARGRDVAEQDHRREQDRLTRNHERAQIEADGRMQLDLHAAKAQKWIELKNQQEDAAMERRIKMLKAVSESGLDSQSILALHLAENPQLASAYAAAAQAQGYEERMEMHRQFEEKLVQMGTQDKAYVNQLLQEGIKQIGSVMTASQNKGRPQVIAGGGSWQQLPASKGQGSEEGNNKESRNTQDA